MGQQAKHLLKAGRVARLVETSLWQAQSLGLDLQHCKPGTVAQSYNRNSRDKNIRSSRPSSAIYGVHHQPRPHETPSQQNNTICEGKIKLGGGGGGGVASVRMISPVQGLSGFLHCKTPTPTIPTLVKTVE